MTIQFKKKGDRNPLTFTQRQFIAKVISNKSLNKNFKLLHLSPLSDIIIPSPGQFYMLQTGNTLDPLLKRPFSIFQYDRRGLKFLYRIKGKGTLLLSNVKKGDMIEVIGPLGNGYPEIDGNFVVIAGGIGIASLYPVLQSHKNRAYVFYGARNRDEHIMLEEIRSISKKLYITTDDGSSGEKGFITDEFVKFINNRGLDFVTVFACGPIPMLKELSKIINKTELQCYVSLEENMACGVGACLGCVVKKMEEEGWSYRCVCKDGPVFNIRDILWE